MAVCACAAENPRGPLASQSSLNQWAPDLVRDPFSKHKVEGNRGSQPVLTSGLHMHTHNNKKGDLLKAYTIFKY